MPVTTRTINGVLRDQSGALLTDHALTIRRVMPIESIDDDVTVVADALVQPRSHASTAAWSANLYPGDHLLTLRTVRGQVTVPFAVPSGTGALDFADLSPQMPEVTPAHVLTAESAATTATDRALDTAVIPANGGPAPSRPWLYVTGANGAPEAMTGYTAAALVTDATHGQCIGITGSATVASRARTRLVAGRVYQATFRARRTVAATGSAPVSFVVRCWQADGTTQTTAIIARNGVAIDTGNGWVETTVTLSLDVAGVDHTIAAGSVLARPFVFVGTASDGQVIVSQVSLSDVTERWLTQQAAGAGAAWAQPFANQAAWMAATIPASVTRVSYLDGGAVVDLVRAADGGDVQTDGTRWQRVARRAEVKATTAYAPAITRVAVDVGSGLYRHVPSIAATSATDLVAAGLYNDSSAAESAAGQRAAFYRSSNAGDTWTAKADELNETATANNPLDPDTEGTIQSEVFVAYDHAADQEIATVAHRAVSANAFSYIATRDASASAKWDIQRVQWSTADGALNLSSTVIGAAQSGYTRLKTIDGAGYEAVAFKPFFDMAGNLIIPFVYLTSFGASHRIGFLIRTPAGVWSEGGIIPVGVLNDGAAWEPTTWQAADGTYICQVRNNSGLGGSVSDNHAYAVSADLLSWSPFAFATEDVHVNRHMRMRARSDLWVGVGTSHTTNRNSLDLWVSGDGHEFVAGPTIGAETDGGDFSQYNDIDVWGDTAFVFYSEQDNHASSPAPNEFRFARFALPSALPISGTRKQEYELNAGTPPSVSGNVLTLPPQMMGSVATAGAAFVVSLSVSVSAAPSTHPYTIASVGSEVDGYFTIQLRDNGGTTELWAGGVYVQDVADPTAFFGVQIAVDRRLRLVTAFGQSAALGRNARVYLGDTAPAGAQAGNLRYDAARSRVTVYDALPARYMPDRLPARLGDVDADSVTASGGQIIADSNTASANIIADAWTGNDSVFRHRIGGSTVAASLYRGASGVWNMQVAGTDVLESDGTRLISKVRHRFDRPVNVTAGTTLTIASGTITPVASYHRVDTEGAASTDDLTNITAAQVGDILILQTVSSARDVTIKHASGNIFCGADRTLNNLADRIMLMCDGSSWHMISYADN